MTLRKLIYSSVFLKSIFVVAVSILVFFSSLSYKHSVSLNQSTELLMHSYKVRVELEKLLSSVKEAESGQRGFLLTQDSFFLYPYIQSKEKVKISYNILKDLVSDNKGQQKNLDTLNTLINSRFEFLLNTLSKTYNSITDKNELKANLIRGKITMDRIHSHVEKMLILETAYLSDRQKNYDDQLSISPLGNLLLSFFSLIVFIFSYYKINKDLEKQQYVNKELLIATESINHAEEIGDFGTWQWDLKNNKLTYSDNQYHLLGCKPQEFEASLQNFLMFVHPDDKNIVVDNRDKIINQDLPTKIKFRIIRKDGQIRYLVSMSKLIADSNGVRFRIGINQDVTEQHLINISLQDKNNELEQTNKELASFNHVASHDLQEPLRKIQIFISRIIEKNETKNLTDSGKEYFEKIQSSAYRMRILIDDLLLFSRTNKAEKIFEKANLNELLENAKQELAQIIEEKKAVLRCMPLPTTYVIPFQIQQLFINLIGNSLKYSKPDVVPVIEINCSQVNAIDYSFLKDKPLKKYFKISVSDNGLGFEQQYAENIFNLFQRLHQDSEYPGTGIGLSICKKIIENHNGFITAKGTLNEGAEFSFYLPMK